MKLTSMCYIPRRPLTRSIWSLIEAWLESHIAAGFSADANNDDRVFAVDNDHDDDTLQVYVWLFALSLIVCKPVHIIWYIYWC